jgi:outer membrane immunogenic protein
MRSLGPALAAFALAAMAFATPVRAADMAVPPSYYPPAAALPPAMYNWTGIYGGANVGGGLLSDSISQATALGTTTISGTQTAHPAGIIGGAQFGANYQFNAWVVGIEGAWSASNLSGYGIGSVTGGPAGVTQERNTSNPLWLAAVSGRVGYAANDWLFYAKGGGAWLRAQYIQDQLIGGVTAASQTLNVNRSGFVAGGGIEYGLTENLSARLEYDFYDFGTKTYQFTATPVNNTSYLHTLTFGLNYRFTPQPTGQPWCPTC